MRQNFSELPAATAVCGRGCRASQASTRSSRCERLTSARSGPAPAGATRKAMAGEPAEAGPQSRRQAPCPRAPQYNWPSAGASTTPATGSPSSTRAILTVNSPLRCRNSFVPSRGSTRKKQGAGPEGAATDSSDNTNTPGKAVASPRRMAASARRSASVTGLPSALARLAKAPAYTSRTSWLAVPAMAHKVCSKSGVRAGTGGLAGAAVSGPIS